MVLGQFLSWISWKKDTTAVTKRSPVVLQINFWVGSVLLRVNHFSMVHSHLQIIGSWESKCTSPCDTIPPGNNAFLRDSWPPLSLHRAPKRAWFLKWKVSRYHFHVSLYFKVYVAKFHVALHTNHKASRLKTIPLQDTSRHWPLKITNLQHLPRNLQVSCISTSPCPWWVRWPLVRCCHHMALHNWPRCCQWWKWHRWDHRWCWGVGCDQTLGSDFL